MNIQTAYWMVRETGGGTAIEMAAKSHPRLTNRDDFASHLSALATKFKYLVRECVIEGTTSYEYFVPMITTGKKGKGKKVIDPDSEGQKWFQKPANQLKLQTIEYLNDNPRNKPPSYLTKNKPKESLTNYASDHDMDEIRIMQDAAKRRLKLKQGLRQALATITKALLDSGEVIELIYDEEQQVIFKYHPYDPENYSLPQVD